MCFGLFACSVAVDILQSKISICLPFLFLSIHCICCKNIYFFLHSGFVTKICRSSNISIVYALAFGEIEWLLLSHSNILFSRTLCPALRVQLLRHTCWKIRSNWESTPILDIRASPKRTNETIEKKCFHRHFTSWFFFFSLFVCKIQTWTFSIYILLVVVHV